MSNTLLRAVDEALKNEYFSNGLIPLAYEELWDKFEDSRAEVERLKEIIETQRNQLARYRAEIRAVQNENDELYTHVTKYVPKAPAPDPPANKSGVQGFKIGRKSHYPEFVPPARYR